MISILLPTRGRPDNLKRFYQSVQDTADDPKDIEVVVAFDSDDIKYDLDYTLHKHPSVTTITTKRRLLSEYWNLCYDKSQGDILMHCGDDIIFRTKGWDTIVKQKFAEYPDRIVFLFGDDGSPHNGIFGTHGFISREWAKAVGYFVPPYFSSDFNDTWLNDVAKLIGRHVHIPILTEHMHPDFGKAELDQTHVDRIKRHQEDGVAVIYNSKESERQQDAEKLRKVMQ